MIVGVVAPPRGAWIETRYCRVSTGTESSRAP